MRPLDSVKILVLSVFLAVSYGSENDVNKQIESILEDKGPVVTGIPPTTLAPVVKPDKKPSISVSGIDDDGKRTDAVKKSDNATAVQVKICTIIRTIVNRLNNFIRLLSRHRACRKSQCMPEV